MALEAVVVQFPGRGWRWEMRDSGSPLMTSVPFYSSASVAASAASAALGAEWPGSPSEEFGVLSDAEEDGWHYVGESGEPAFTADWENVGSPFPALAFRLREAGVVDVVGVISRISTSAAGDVFELPEAYRPNNQVSVPVYVLDSSTTPDSHLAGMFVVSTNGTLSIAGPDVPVGNGYVYISGSFFLDTAAP